MLLNSLFHESLKTLVQDRQVSWNTLDAKCAGKFLFLSVARPFADKSSAQQLNLVLLTYKSILWNHNQQISHQNR